MLKFTRRLKGSEHFDVSLTLPFELRIKARLKVQLDNGDDAGLFLNRGPILRNGDCIATDDGLIAAVYAAEETVSTVYCESPLLLAKAAYHLGNRHTPLQIDEGMVRYQHDHVLDQMVEAMGLIVKVEQAAFEPEPGAYGEHQSGHSHAHTH